jgi:hypothetical protein
VTDGARHSTSEQLIDLIEQRLSAADRSRVETHLSSCRQCSRQAAALGHLIEVMRTDDSRDAPEHVLNRAFRLLRIHRLSNAPDSARRRFRAILRLDSAQQGLALGVRAGRPMTRHLLFDIGDDNELEVRIERAESGWRVAGQILGTCHGGQVVLEGVSGQATTELNSQCEFSLPPQPGAIYKLVLELQDVEVEVPILELRG